MPYQPTIQRARVVLTPFSSEQMAAIGSIMCDTIAGRIRSHKNGEDQESKPLRNRSRRKPGSGYPNRKIQRGLQPYRDWTWTGRTLRGLKVKFANENRVTIGFVDDRSDMIAHFNNLKERAFTTSPKDREVLYAAIHQTQLTQHTTRVRRVA